MIALATPSPLLQRFVVELAGQTPRAIPEAPDLSAYRRDEVEAARIAWAGRIVDEYRSVAIFSELLQLLTDLEAPFAALCAVQRLIGDELRHTQLTAQVVDWLGGADDLEIDLAGVSLPPRTESAESRARRIVARELVVVEEESVLVLAAYRNATTNPAIRDVFSLLLADEVRHAAAGRALFELLGTTPEVDAEIIADRAQVRADYRSSAIGGAGRTLGACIEPTDLAAVWARAA